MSAWWMNRRRRLHPRWTFKWLLRVGMYWRIHIVFPQHISDNSCFFFFATSLYCSAFVSLSLKKISPWRQYRSFAQPGKTWPHEARTSSWNLSIFASVSFSNKLKLKDWNWRTHNTDISNLDEHKFVYKKNYLWRKMFSEILKYEACTRWEKWKELSSSYELMTSQCKKKERESWDNSTAHFSFAGNARSDEFYESFGRFSRCGIKL